MSAPVTVIIAGEPVAKGRARITRKGFAYTPAHTRKYEAHGRLAAQLGMDGRSPIESPVRQQGGRRRFGLVAVDAYEDVSALREISNRAADEFQELRDEIVEERAAFAAP